MAPSHSRGIKIENKNKEETVIGESHFSQMLQDKSPACLYPAGYEPSSPWGFPTACCHGHATHGRSLPSPSSWSAALDASRFSTGWQTPPFRGSLLSGCLGRRCGCRLQDDSGSSWLTWAVPCSCRNVFGTLLARTGVIQCWWISHNLI